jgi:hypothetical protein
MTKRSMISRRYAVTTRQTFKRRIGAGKGPRIASSTTLTLEIRFCLNVNQQKTSARTKPATKLLFHWNYRSPVSIFRKQSLGPGMS